MGPFEDLSVNGCIEFSVIDGVGLKCNVNKHVEGESAQCVHIYLESDIDKCIQDQVVDAHVNMISYTPGEVTNWESGRKCDKEGPWGSCWTWARKCGHPVQFICTHG